MAEQADIDTILKEIKALQNFRKTTTNSHVQHSKPTHLETDFTDSSPSNESDSMDEYHEPPPDPPNPPARSPPFPASPQAQDPILLPTADINHTRRVMADPYLWQWCIEDMQTLGHLQWLRAEILDNFLLSRWLATPNSPVRYLQQNIGRSGNDLHGETLDRILQGISFRLRLLYQLHPTDDLRIIPIIFPVLMDNHYFLVFMDHSNHRVFVIGRVSQPRDHDPWEEWDGPHIYTCVCRMHGWEVGDISTVNAYNINLPQNGSDCGIVAAQAALYIFEHGLQLTTTDDEVPKLQLPPHICAHLTRAEMFQTVSRNLYTAYDDYHALVEEQPPFWDITNDDRRTAIEADNRWLTRLSDFSPDNYHRDDTFRDLLDCITNSCNLCKLAPAARTAWQTLFHSLHHAPTSDPTISNTDPADIIFNTNHTAHVHDNNTSLRPKNPYKEIRNPLLGNPAHFSRLIPPLMLPVHNPAHWPNHDDAYDDYYNGPVSEELPTDMTQFKVFGAPDYWYVPQTNQKEAAPTLLSLFKDNGFRLTKRFPYMHFLSDPWAIPQHILTPGIPPDTDYDPSTYYPTMHGLHTAALEGFNIPSISALTRDIALRGATELLNAARDASPERKRELFIQGRWDNAHLICLDLERDAIPIPSEAIHCTIDIDSIIWVTCNLHVNIGIDINLAPPVGRTPPVRKNNHVYIHLLHPPSQAERDSGDMNWKELATPISTIPHANFGRLADGIHIHIFFPRMFHKDPDRRRHGVLIPSFTLTLLWDTVVIPALQKCATPGMEAYISPSVESARRKAASGERRTGTAYNPKTLFVTTHILKNMLKQMQAIITANNNLAQFGSFFFVLDLKNYKLATRMPLSRITHNSTPWTLLKEACPRLALNHMLDRANGELSVDIVFAFHPNHATTMEHPVVGLWRLDVLDSSFGAAEFTRGKQHNIALLNRYGAIQAHMALKRSRVTHAVSRSAYNLTYEVIRPPTIVLQSLKKTFSGPEKNSTYGVRDEYRVGGQTMQMIFDNASSLAKTFLKSEPILWIPTNIWFEFCAMRIDELQRLQITLYRLRPPNYGVLTCLICYLIETMTNTPTIIPQPVRNSLALLSAQNIINRFGILFLHNLDLSDRLVIPEIQEFDDEDVRRTLGFHTSTKRRKRPCQPQQPYNRSVAYPLGTSPTWRELAEAIDITPEAIIKDWSMPFHVDTNPLANRLFVNFTQQVWFLLKDSWKTPASKSPITSIEDAMTVWTLAGIRDRILRISFKPCNAGIPGPITAPREPSFRDRMRWYFPEPGPSPRKGSQWHIMHLKPCYIFEYHFLRARLCVDDKLSLDVCLQEIFANLQCLPISLRPETNGYGWIWKKEKDTVTIITNPRFYRIDSIGTHRSRQLRGSPISQTFTLQHAMKQGEKTQNAQQLQRTAGSHLNGDVKMSIQLQLNLRLLASRADGRYEWL
ncbi:hypothetical protein C8Q80DRAFT_1276446 [Daedaleopsis nitida]|nr:hypothetical protein C8Q80DRAFT_1276446 [Daedaleopsis nitida]